MPRTVHLPKGNVMHILRGLSSYILNCGCLVGVYETYKGAIVRVVDKCDDACRLHCCGTQVCASMRKERGVSYRRGTLLHI